MAPEFVDIYVRLGEGLDAARAVHPLFGSYGCASTFGPVDPEPLDRRAAELERAGLPLFDAFHETPGWPRARAPPPIAG